MLDVNMLSVLFLTDLASVTNSPVTSLGVRSLSDANSIIQSLKESQSKILKNSEMEVLFTLTRNAHISVRDVTTGNLVSLKPLHPEKNSAAISMHIIGRLIIKKSRKNYLNLHQVFFWLEDST